MKFRTFFFNVLRLAEFLILRSSLFHSDASEEKKRVFKIIVSYFYRRDMIAKPSIANPTKIRLGIK